MNELLNILYACELSEDISVEDFIEDYDLVLIDDFYSQV